MSPRLNHVNLGEVQKTAYLTATITSVDSVNDLASFTGIGKCPDASDIPIFYHCEYSEGEEPSQRDNGALEGSAGAFSEGDEVIVQCKILDSTTYKPLYVIGFVGKPKQCLPEFRFKLERSDGAIITDEILDIGDPSHFITLYNSINATIPGTLSYNDTTQEWTYQLLNNDIDPDGYWMRYRCGCGFKTQYPGRAQQDWLKVEDLIHPGEYEDTIRLSCFQLKLTRGDDVLLGEGVHGISIACKNSYGSTRTLWKTFDAETGYWMLEMKDGYFDSNGYFLYYNCDDGIATQYPYRYKTADKGNPADLILPGTYEDTIPYWKVEGWNDPVPLDLYPDSPDCFDTATLGVDGVALSGFYTRYLHLGDGVSAERKIRVKSSVPYNVTYHVAGEDLEGLADHYAVDNWLWYIDETTGCEDWGQMCPGTGPGVGGAAITWWNTDETMEVTFTAPGISYICKKDNFVDQQNIVPSGPTIEGAVYEIEVENTTPSNKTGRTGSETTPCESSGPLAFTDIPDGLDSFGVGASYQ